MSGDYPMVRVSDIESGKVTPAKAFFGTD